MSMKPWPTPFPDPFLDPSPVLVEEWAVVWLTGDQPILQRNDGATAHNIGKAHMKDDPFDIAFVNKCGTNQWKRGVRTWDDRVMRWEACTPAEVPRKLRMAVLIG